MFDLDTYLIPEVVVGCLILGYILKHWIKDVDNKWIPTAVCIAGIAGALVLERAAIPDVSAGLVVGIGGALSGLASTGLHQMVKQWLDNGLSQMFKQWINDGVN